MRMQGVHGCVAVCVGRDIAKASYVGTSSHCYVHSGLKQDLLTAGLQASFLYTLSDTFCLDIVRSHTGKHSVVKLLLGAF